MQPSLTSMLTITTHAVASPTPSSESRLSAGTGSVRVLRSLDELADVAGDWDALVDRCHQPPTYYAKLLADWAQHFAADARFHAILLYDGNDRLVAGVPLLRRRWLRCLRVGELPRNHFASCGDLLLDPAYRCAEWLDLLISSLQELAWPAVCFRSIPLDSTSWREFRSACLRADLRCEDHVTHRIGVIDFPADWEAYHAALHGNHRRHMNKALRRADRTGGVSLRIERPTEAHQVAELVRCGFEIEARSWKGRVSSALIQDSERYDYYQRQAQQLTQRGSLHLAFLDYCGRPIAFEYGLVSATTYYTPKVGYDEQFRDLSPGQLLRFLLYQRFLTEGPRYLVDFDGPLTPATAKWSTDAYPVGHLLVTPRRLRSLPIHTAFRLYRWRKRRSQSAGVSNPSVVLNNGTKT